MRRDANPGNRPVGFLGRLLILRAETAEYDEHLLESTDAWKFCAQSMQGFESSVSQAIVTGESLGHPMSSVMLDGQSDEEKLNCPRLPGNSEVSMPEARTGGGCRSDPPSRGTDNDESA